MERVELLGGERMPRSESASNVDLRIKDFELLTLSRESSKLMIAETSSAQLDFLPRRCSNGICHSTSSMECIQRHRDKRRLAEALQYR